jgi:stress-induced morphogen
MLLAAAISRARCFTLASFLHAGSAPAALMRGARRLVSVPTTALETGGPVQQSIEQILRDTFPVAHLVMENESYKHSSGNRTQESHFKLLLVSEAFKGQSLVKRHRMVTEAVSKLTPTNELPVHALSIQAKTPEEWSPAQGIHKTPSCVGRH